MFEIENAREVNQDIKL